MGGTQLVRHHVLWFVIAYGLTPGRNFHPSNSLGKRYRYGAASTGSGVDGGLVSAGHPGNPPRDRVLVPREVS